MFVPPYRFIQERVTLRRVKKESPEKVILTAGLLRFLLQTVLAESDFDEAQYLRCNPDVAGAVERGEFADGRAHFIQTGYFEGRVGAIPVHEAWYLTHNPDVAEAKQAGLIESGEVQYRLAGASEWREPNPEAAGSVKAWRKALNSQAG
jgi:hypothetical protein